MFSSPCRGFALTPEPRDREVFSLRVLLWTTGLDGKTMSLPGVFGTVTSGETAGELLDAAAISLPGVAGRLPGISGAVHPLVSSRPGVLGLSEYINGPRKSSVFAGESSAKIPLPGVKGRSSSSSAGDEGLLLVRSASLSVKQPVGVNGLRLSVDKKRR